MGSEHCYPWHFEFQYYQNHMGIEVILDRMPPYRYYIKPDCQLIMLLIKRRMYLSSRQFSDCRQNSAQLM